MGKRYRLASLGSGKTQAAGPGDAIMKHRFLMFAMLALGSAWPVSGAFATAQPIFWSALRPADQARATVPLSPKMIP